MHYLSYKDKKICVPIGVHQELLWTIGTVTTKKHRGKIIDALKRPRSRNPLESDPAPPCCLHTWPSLTRFFNLDLMSFTNMAYIARHMMSKCSSYNEQMLVIQRSANSHRLLSKWSAYDEQMLILRWHSSYYIIFLSDKPIQFTAIRLLLSTVILFYSLIFLYSYIMRSYKDKFKYTAATLNLLLLVK